MRKTLTLADKTSKHLEFDFIHSMSLIIFAQYEANGYFILFAYLGGAVNMKEHSIHMSDDASGTYSVASGLPKYHLEQGKQHQLSSVESDTNDIYTLKSDGHVLDYQKMDDFLGYMLCSEIPTSQFMNRANFIPSCDDRSNEQNQIPSGTEYKASIQRSPILIFLLSELQNPITSQSIRWTGNGMEFQLIEPQLLAEKWGSWNKNQKMNLTRFIRALKYQCEKKSIQKCSEGNHLYKFNAPLKELLDMSSVSMAFSKTRGRIRLWEFLLEQLRNPNATDIIHWMNESMEFKIEQPKLLAKCWGIRTNNSRMSFAKILYAIRDSCEKLIEKVPRQRLVYRFTRPLDELLSLSDDQL